MITRPVKFTGHWHRTIRAACLAGLSMFAAHGAQAQTVNCAALIALDEVEVKNALLVISDNVLGKPALDWTESDYTGLLRTARACHGVVDGARTLRYGAWETQLNQARKVLLPLAQLRDTSVKAIADLPLDKAKLPQCETLHTYSFDAISGLDNSDKVFGMFMADMSVQDLDAIVEMTKHCGAYLPVMETMRSGAREADTIDFLKGVAGRSMLLQARHKAREKAIRYDSDLTAKVDGKPAPTILLSDEAWNLVVEVNKLKSSEKRASNKEISRLAGIAGMITSNSGLTRVDRAYAEAAGIALRSMIFQ